MNELTQKARAREIIEQLHALDNTKRPGGGVHGQVVGCEPYVIRTSGFGLQCLYDAQALLDELLDPFDRRAPTIAPDTGELAKLAYLRSIAHWEDERDMGPGGRWWLSLLVSKGRPTFDEAITQLISCSTELPAGELPQLRTELAQAYDDLLAANSRIITLQDDAFTTSHALATLKEELRHLKEIRSK